MCAGELQGAALTRLALQTLGSFDFGSMRLLDFVRDHVTLFLDDPDVSVRRAAAAAAAKVLHRAASVPPGSHGSISQNQVGRPSAAHLVCLGMLSWRCTIFTEEACLTRTSLLCIHEAEMVLVQCVHATRLQITVTVLCTFADAYQGSGGCSGTPSDGSMRRRQHSRATCNTPLCSGALFLGHLLGPG